MLALFDRSVTLILLYGCEVGVTGMWTLIIERIYLKFCETPLSVLIYARLIKFWAKIVSPVDQFYKNKNCNWIRFVKSKLET